MPANYLPYEPNQDFLLPPSLREWLPEGHLAYFIGDTVDTLDLAAFHARYEKDGPRNQPFHPAMMVKVLLYGYVIRNMARALSVSADALVFEQDERGPGEELLLQFEAISQLPPEEQAVVKEVLESLIIKYQTRRWDLSRTGAKSAAPAKKTAAAKRVAHAAR